MHQLFQQWDKTHEDAKQHIRDYLRLTADYNQPFVKLARWCLTTKLSPFDFMPSGWTVSLNNSISAYGFLSTLHHAMVDDGDYCFAMSNTGPCIEFCNKNFLDEYWQYQPLGSRRKNGEWLDWSVDKFITEIESYHIAKNLERERLEQQRLEFLAGFLERPKRSAP